jgi:hypothetical protein
MTFAPACTNAAAIERPMPLAAPVTTARLLSSRNPFIPTALFLAEGLSIL